jgi:hypothetical protein
MAPTVGRSILLSSNVIQFQKTNHGMSPKQVVTLTLVGNIELIHSSATPDYNLD